jgi:redox-sensitive bicupin YhaK (pirin superfamily)
MAPPRFTMFWSEDIPRRNVTDGRGRRSEITVIASCLPDFNDAALGVTALLPPPDSWASRADADVAIWTIRMAPGASWVLPAAAEETTRRSLYFFKGRSVAMARQDVSSPSAIELPGNLPIELMNGNEESEFLLLQGKLIGESVVQYGPFVMNTQPEIVQAMADYRRTRFGGWPWENDAPVHGRDPARFARHHDGREEHPSRVRSD